MLEFKVVMGLTLTEEEIILRFPRNGFKALISRNPNKKPEKLVLK